MSTAPIYFIALMIGSGLMILFNQDGGTKGSAPPLAEIAIGVGIFFLLGSIAAAAHWGRLPEPFGGLITTLVTGVGYFVHLVVGPIAFAAMAILIGAVATVVTHNLVGEYA